LAARRFRIGGVASAAALVLATAGATNAQTSFDQALMTAMSRMQAAMLGAPMTGDPDRDFVAMMVPHHRGAIDMALLELEHGRDPRLIRLAQEIVVTQRSEIQVMRAVARDLSQSVDSKKGTQ
jgi:uncharacterized protein (DUF305 family)